MPVCGRPLSINLKPGFLGDPLLSAADGQEPQIGQHNQYLDNRGIQSHPNSAVYSAFKGALTSFSRSLALELASDGIRVNAIAPETTESASVVTETRIVPEHRDNIANWIPLGRFGVPEDIAGCALFLASDLSSWVTGTTIHVDGGALAAAGWVRMSDGRWTHRPLITGSGYQHH